MEPGTLFTLLQLFQHPQSAAKVFGVAKLGAQVFKVFSYRSKIYLKNSLIKVEEKIVLERKRSTRMKSILTLKHWQVFIVPGLSYAINVAIWGSHFSIGNISSLDITVTFGIIYLISFFLWILTLGIFTNSISENPYQFRKGILVFSVLCAMTGYIELNLQRLTIEGFIIPNWFSILMGPLTAFGIIYTFYNIPKSIKSIELGRKVSFKECIIDTILLFAFPIGVWFIQPRINRLYVVNELIEKEKE